MCLAMNLRGPRRVVNDDGISFLQGRAMHKFSYTRICDSAIDIDYLEVQSFEMNVYLVFLKANGHAGFVYDKDSPKRFYSTSQIREVFAHCTVKQAVMKHDSPYDEMIGNPPKSAEQMALPFTMQLPY